MTRAAPPGYPRPSPVRLLSSAGGPACRLGPTTWHRHSCNWQAGPLLGSNAAPSPLRQTILEGLALPCAAPSRPASSLLSWPAFWPCAGLHAPGRLCRNQAFWTRLAVRRRFYPAGATQLCRPPRAVRLGMSALSTRTAPCLLRGASPAHSNGLSAAGANAAWAPQFIVILGTTSRTRQFLPALARDSIRWRAWRPCRRFGRVAHTRAAARMNRNNAADCCAPLRVSWCIRTSPRAGGRLRCRTHHQTFPAGFANSWSPPIVPLPMVAA